MPRVPVYENTTQQLNDYESYSSASGDPQAFGVGLSQSMMQASQSLGNMSKEWYTQKEEEENLSVESRYNNEAFEMFRQADLDYTSQSGGNAVKEYDNATKKLQEAKQRILGSIEAPTERQKMDILLGKRINQSAELYGRHRQTQFEVFEEETFKADLANSAKSASDFEAVPEVSDRFVRTGLFQIEEFARKKGWPPEKVQQAQQEHMDVVLGNLADVKFQRAPQEGARWLADNQDKMSTEVYVKKMRTYKPILDDMQAQDYVNNAIAGLPTQGMEQPVKGAVFDVKPLEKDAKYDGRYDGFINEASSKYGVRPALAKKMFGVESNYDPNAVSPKGAVGLGQIMSDTAKELGLTDEERRDPQKSIEKGLLYLKQQIDRFGGNEVLGVAAYNAGAGRLLGGVDKETGIRYEGAISKAKKKYNTDNPTTGQIIGLMNKETRNHIDKIFDTTAGDVAPVIEKNKPTPEQPTQSKPDLTTKAGINTFYAQEVTKAQRIQDKGQRDARISKLNTFKNTRLSAINAQIDTNNEVISSAFVNDIIANGVLDVNRVLRENEGARNAFASMPPPKQLSIMKMGTDSKKNSSTQIEKESQISANITKAFYTDNPDLLKSFDPFDPKQGAAYTPKTASELALWKAQQSKDKPSDPMQTNINQGKRVFNEIWGGIYQKPTTQKTFRSGDVLTQDGKTYYYQYGVFEERLKEAMEGKKGKPLTREEQEQVVDGVIADTSREVVYYVDRMFLGGLGDDDGRYEKKVGITEFVTSMTGKGGKLEDYDKEDVTDYVLSEMNNGRVVDIETIRKVLGGKK